MRRRSPYLGRAWVAVVAEFCYGVSSPARRNRWNGAEIRNGLRWGIRFQDRHVRSLRHPSALKNHEMTRIKRQALEKFNMRDLAADREACIKTL